MKHARPISEPLISVRPFLGTAVHWSPKWSATFNSLRMKCMILTLAPEQRSTLQLLIHRRD